MVVVCTSPPSSSSSSAAASSSPLIPLLLMMSSKKKQKQKRIITCSISFLLLLLFSLLLFTISFPLHSTADIQATILSTLFANSSSSSSSSSANVMPSNHVVSISSSSSLTTVSPPPPPSSSSSLSPSSPPPLPSSSSSSSSFVNSSGNAPLPSDSGENLSGIYGGGDDSSCDLFKGQWITEESATTILYRPETCPILTQTQDCQGNGRPDNGYERWRWRPDGCELAPFDPRIFLSTLRGKTLAFAGDSVARNQMESLVCMLWQVEEPMNRGSKKMQRWYFRSFDTTIIRVWSSWLVNTTSEPWDYAPANLTKLKLEEPDPNLMELLPRIHVLVISGGHWFAKKTAYLLGGKLVGGQLWSHKNLVGKGIPETEAFGIAMETSLSSIATDPLYKGLTILRTYSPDHYDGGTWNTGGSCTEKTRPAMPWEVSHNPHTELMRSLQLRAFANASRNISNGSTLRLLDVTPVFEPRADGHPGPYRNRDPNKITTRAANGRPPPQDCLHWCMPGPIDTWNQLMLQILREETSSI